MNPTNPSVAVQLPTIFVSYHHGRDADYFEQIQRALFESFDVVRDYSARQELRGRDAEFVTRAIRERQISKTSCTLVLCGEETGGRKFVDWEISATLDKQHGLICIILPEVADSVLGLKLPPRAQDNIESGYAQTVGWQEINKRPSRFIDAIKRANSASKDLIRNDRPLLKASHVLA